jgi:hypothetical protein
MKTTKIFTLALLFFTANMLHAQSRRRKNKR